MNTGTGKIAHRMVNEHSMGEKMQPIYYDKKSLFHRYTQSKKKGKMSCEYDLWLGYSSHL